MPNHPSRRDFISMTAGGVAACWPGLRMLAGTDADMKSTAPSRAQDNQKFFVYGAHFARPPTPPASVRRAMLKEFSGTYKFNTVRLYPSWAYQNPRQNLFDFSEVEEVLRYCDEFGLKVLMGVVLEDAPFWLEATHQDSRYVNAKNQAYRLGNNGDDVTAGWPGLCLDWPPVREAAQRYIRAMVRTVSAHASLYAYDCWNEPHTEAAEHHLIDFPIDMESVYCYCSQTVRRFQHWLQQRYITLNRLSEAWVRRYADWSQIDPPRRKGPYLDWIDWRRFMIERSTQEMEFRVAQVRSVDALGALESHLGLQAAVDSPLAILGVNPWRLAEVVETWGISYFPRWRVMESVSLGVARLELTRSQAGSKPFWVTELQGGYSERDMRPRDIRLWNWLAVAAGAKGIVYWTYHPDIVGPQAGDFGLVDLGGRGTERVVEAAEDHRLIQAHWDILKDYKPRPEVALLFDQDCALLTFAMTGNEAVSGKSFRGYYRALWNCDLWADFIEVRTLANHPYKVIIAPGHRILTRETAVQLVRFVREGGTLIVEAGFGSYDDHAFRNFVVPPHGLAELFGYREDQEFQLTDAATSGSHSKEPAPLSERIYESGHLDFTAPVAITVRAHTCLTRIAVGDASVVATYESMPVAAMKRLDRGRVYFIGTNFGATIEAGHEGALELMRAILAEAVRAPISAAKVRPRLIEGQRRSLLVVCNEGTEDQRATFEVPSRYQHATDLYDGQNHTFEGYVISVTTPFQGVSVLLLE